jgi:hypothetical protein
MRRGALAAVVASLLLLAPGAGASHDPSGEPFDEDFVTGEAIGELCVSLDPPFCVPQTTTIDAHSGPSGEQAGGSVVVDPAFDIEFGLGPASGGVFCLKVDGNRAFVGAVFPARVQVPHLFAVEDNSATGEPDRFWSGDGDISLCSTAQPVVFTPVESGDLTVHDAVPLPTSKDQCKRGGWRNFGTRFKNEGQCVAFVQRRPKL